MPKDDEKRPLTPEEVELWEQVTQDDERMPGKEFVKGEEEVGEDKRRRGKERKRERGREIEKEVEIKEKGGSVYPYLHVGESAGVDRRTADRLKKGKMKIEGRLDLHGLYQEEALEALQHFVTASYNAGKRSLLIITGKGYRSEDAVGVLRENVPRWLNLPDLRPLILMFTTARQEDGGDGALYVLLKRKR